MERLTKETLLGASDLEEEEVELPTIGGSVVVRSLPAAYSNKASSEAMTLVTGARGEQQATIDTAKLELIQVLHGLVEPKLNSLAEAEVFAQKCGRAFKTVVAKIDELSGIDKDEIEAAEARFPSGGESPNGTPVADATPSGGSGPDLHARVGVGAGHDD